MEFTEKEYLDKVGLTKLIALLKSTHYTKGEVDELLKNINFGDGDVNVDLSGYVKKEEMLWEKENTGIKTKDNNNSTTNPHEVAIGTQNDSTKNSDSFGDSQNTLFSIGNSEETNVKHNAFEVKQSGDILIPDVKNPLHSSVDTNKKPMINLQEKLKNLELPDGGIVGQVLTITDGGVSWENPQLQEAPEMPEIPQAMWMKDTEGSKTGLKPIGVTNKVTGNFAFTGGYNTEAINTLATTFGQGTLAQNKLEIAFGQFNNSIKNSDTGTSSEVFGDPNKTFFTIGNGYNYTKKYPHNAFEIRQNGDIYFPDVVEGVNYYETAMRRLQDIPKVWKGTWEEYSKLEKLDDNTMYYIYENSIKNLYPEEQLNDFGSYKATDAPDTIFELEDKR